MTYILHFDFTIKTVTNMCVIYHSMVCRGVHQNGVDVSSPGIFDQSCYMRPAAHPCLFKTLFIAPCLAKEPITAISMFLMSIDHLIRSMWVPLNSCSKLFISHNVLNGNWTRFHSIEIGIHA
eukprot:TRINITY_DN19220_c3_g1_i1.p1 TRINITY_DN19220_c3_g1~~TRINITY_DN19220_c3_g1_i1.p1  ORF type:complete len:122 (-),score=6.21 TRINITY_DN19220_c3_g1_i1:249-614(-)